MHRTLRRFRRLVEPGMRVSAASPSRRSSSMRGLAPLLPALLLLLLTQPWGVAGVLPTGMIEFKSTKGYTYCAGGDFGPFLPSKKHAPELVLIEPADATNQMGCTTPLVLPPSLPANQPFALLLARGKCSFESKTVAAEAAGASLLIIYNNEEGIYYNKTAATPKLDYECSNGQAFLPTIAEPLWSPLNNPPSCATDPKCASGRCLVTNHTDISLGGTEVCCAWDVYMTMGPDPTIETATSSSLPSSPSIPTVYVTMRDADALKAAVQAATLVAASSSLASSSSMATPLKQQVFGEEGREGGVGLFRISVYERPRPAYNLASILIWLLGCATVSFAAWNSSRVKTGGRKGGVGREAVLMDGREGGVGRLEEEEEEEEEEELPAIELSIGHTIGFICMASCFLILLFYVDLNRVISGLYSLSAGSAVATIAARPFLKFVLPKRVARKWVVNYRRWDVRINVLDFSSTFMGLGMGVWWFVVREKASYAWVLQDIMGVCLCVLFLTLVRFPNIKVATVLLVLAFLYDIFFVFLSPVFFHESVMIKVATVLLVLAFLYDFFFVFLSPVILHESVMMKVATGGAPKADETYCEKYPKDKDCHVRDTLPMLLVLPRINDYATGFTMLGLGDIILPGLLVAFAARYDRAMGKRHLLAFQKCCSERSYFRLMVIGYAIGLMMANIAVYAMKMGQPALLYLVPCTLGVFALVSYREGTLLQMWQGPPALQPPRLPQHQEGGEGGEEGLPAAGAEGAAAVATPVEGSVRVGSEGVVAAGAAGAAAGVVGGRIILGGNGSTTTGAPSVTEEDAPLLDI